MTELQARIDDYWDHRASVYDEAQHTDGRDVVDRQLWGRVCLRRCPWRPPEFSTWARAAATPPSSWPPSVTR